MELLQIDTTAVEGVLSDLLTAGTSVVAVGIGVAAAIFGLLWVWRKAKGALS